MINKRKVIEESFFDLYRDINSPAYECATLVEKEHGLGRILPRSIKLGAIPPLIKSFLANTSKASLVQPKKQKPANHIDSGLDTHGIRIKINGMVFLSPDDIRARCKVLHRLLHEDDSLMDEIEGNLNLCKDHEERVRYAITLVAPFKGFADKFHPGSRIRSFERTIKRLEEEAARTDNSEKKASIKEEIEACEQDIATLRKTGTDLLGLAKNGYKDKETPPSMENCLYDYFSGMETYACKLASLLLAFHILLPDIQRRCGICLKESFGVWDYVDRSHVPDYDYAKQLLDELTPPEPPSAPAAPETAPMKTYAIFHDNLDEDKIASALRSIPRGSVGEIKFAYTVNKVFKAIGWLADRMNTHFVAWMKQQRIIAVKTGDFKSVKGEDPQMKALETVVRGTFTTLLPNGSLKDHDRFYKKNRWLINKGD